MVEKMKIKLELELDYDESTLKELKEKITEEDYKEELTQMLFEVCEEWVLRGQQPDLEFEK